MNGAALRIARIVDIDAATSDCVQCGNGSQPCMSVGACGRTRETSANHPLLLLRLVQHRPRHMRSIIHTELYLCAIQWMQLMCTQIRILIRLQSRTFKQYSRLVHSFAQPTEEVFAENFVRNSSDFGRRSYARTILIVHFIPYLHRVRSSFTCKRHANCVIIYTMKKKTSFIRQNDSSAICLSFMWAQQARSEHFFVARFAWMECSAMPCNLREIILIRNEWERKRQR